MEYALRMPWRARQKAMPGQKEAKQQPPMQLPAQGTVPGAAFSVMEPKAQQVHATERTMLPAPPGSAHSSHGSVDHAPCAGFGASEC